MDPRGWLKTSLSVAAAFTVGCLPFVGAYCVPQGDAYPVKLSIRGQEVSMSSLPFDTTEVVWCLESTLDAVGYPPSRLAGLRVNWFDGTDDAGGCHVMGDGAELGCTGSQTSGCYVTRFDLSTVTNLRFCPGDSIGDTALPYEVIRRHLLHDRGMPPAPVPPDTQRSITEARTACGGLQ